MSNSGACGWEKGYAAFSVRYSDAERVVRYIRNQEHHHQRKTLDAELQRFLWHHDMPDQAGVNWD